MPSYEPKLQRKAADKALAHLRDTYRTRSVFLAAVDEFWLALLNLGANPRQAVSPPGLFEKRPIYQFILNPDGIPRTVQVCFCYDPNDSREQTILITDFLAIA